MYPLKYHPGLDKRWHTFTASQQIIMIANEMNRAKNMLAKNDTYEMKQALERAFELVDLTVENARQHLQYELLRFREVLCAIYLDQHPSLAFLEKLNSTLLELVPDA
ncbi:hypothetical protein JXB22_01155 [candidate division WOR-3 bacterium]|nr:hypothetical protein [candidate division WOR-3 bacterium]